MAIGAEEAYQMFSRIPTPGGDQALQQLNQNTSRKLDTQRWMAEENAQNERDKWRGVSDAFKTGIDQYNRAQERDYRAGRDAVTDKREQARLDADLARSSLENERTKGLMEDEQRNRAWENGTEEGQAISRGDQRRAALLKADVQRPDIEKTNADLNAATTRSTLARNSAELKHLAETDRQAQEDRNVAQAANRYRAAGADQRKVAELDAEYGKKLGPSGIELAKQKAVADKQQSQMVTDMNVRSTEGGQQAIHEIAQANADATTLSQAVNDALDYIKATPGSAEADSAKQRVLSALPQNEAEYVTKGGGVGLAGYNLDTSGFSKPQDRMVTTLQRIRGDLQKKVEVLKQQYGQMPSSEIQQGLGQLEQVIQKIDVGLSGQQRNSIQLVGGGAPGARNSDFFTPRAPAAPAPNPQGHALGTIRVGGAPGGQPMPMTPTMRDSQINRQLPAVGASR
jgi:hypothetical protein